jgi:maleate cis-trans isomerase
MIGSRARLGFLLPPGNRTIEPEMIVMCARPLDGQAERDSRYRRCRAIRRRRDE